MTCCPSSTPPVAKRSPARFPTTRRRCSPRRSRRAFPSGSATAPPSCRWPSGRSGEAARGSARSRAPDARTRYGRRARRRGARVGGRGGAGDRRRRRPHDGAAHGRRHPGRSRPDRAVGRRDPPPRARAGGRDRRARATERHHEDSLRARDLDSAEVRAASFVTKVGSTAGLRPSSPDVVVVSEPTLGATLRTKGRFYFLCEVAPAAAPAGQLAREVADLARQEYYYDLAAGALTERLGAEALKNAAVTLHPRAAAEHIHNRAIADGVAGSDAALFIEITAAPAAAERLRAEPAPPPEAEEVVIAETIRSRLDWIWRRRPHLGRAIEAAAAPATRAVGKGVAVGLELMPRRSTALPRHPDTARQRSRRQRRAASLLAVVLLLVAGGIGALAYRDYAAQRVGGDYTLAIIAVENDLSSARRSADRKPPDVDAARDRLTHARAKLDEAARSPIADQAKVAALRDELAKIDDDITGVVVDLARLLPGAKPAAIVGNLNGLYVTDPGVGRLWRIFGDPAQTGVVLAQGARDVGVPRLVATFGDAVYALDDQQHLWRAQGDKVADVTPDAAADTWKSVASFSVFAANLYVLDAASGQVWKHESSDGIDFDRNRVQGYLETAVAPNAAASLAVDGDVWIVTTAGEVIRYRALTTSFTAP